MTRRQTLTSITGLSLLAFGGCGDILNPDSSKVTIVGVGGGRVFYEYHKEYIDLEFMPSSLWRLELDTGKTTRIHEPTLQVGVQAAGDYYVTELVRNGKTTGKVTAFQISTGRRTTLYERDFNRSPRIHLLSGERVVVLTDDGLAVFDLPSDTLTKTIDLSDDTFVLQAFEGDQVLIEYGPHSLSDGAVLINLSTDERVEIPPAPTIRHTSFQDAKITPTSIAAFGVEFLAFDEGPELSDFPLIKGSDLLLFDIATATWRVLAEYEPQSRSGFFIPYLFVAGLDDMHVVVEVGNFSYLSGSSSIESINTQTGEREILARSSGGFLWDFLDPHFDAGRVYWIDPILLVVVIHDIESGTKEITPLQRPD